MTLSREMGIPFGEFMARTTADDLALYLAEETLAPHGDDRLEQLFAMLCCVVASCVGAKADIYDFMPFRERPEQSMQEQMAILRHAATGG